MGSKDKDTKSLQDKLKVFFKKGPIAAGAGPGAAAGGALRQELVLTAELQRELSAAAGAARRLRAMRELAERAAHLPMTEGGVASVWSLVRDCLRAAGEAGGAGGAGAGGAGAELRGGALRLLAALAGAQAAQLRMLRTVLLRWLRAALAERADAPPDDAALRFKLLYNLTNSGKDISGIEEEICAVCVEWARADAAGAAAGAGGAGAAPAGALLALLTTAVKYNAAYLADRDLDLILQLACEECALGGAGAGAALALCEAVAAYALVPRAALARLVRALLGCVAGGAGAGAARAAWRLLRALLAGAAAAHVLRAMLDAAADAPPATARAAVWATGTALWGPRRVAGLQAPAAAVLPALLAAARLPQPAVAAEVLAALALLLRRPAELHELEWDALLAALGAAARLQAAPGVARALDAALAAVERLQDAGQYRGPRAAWGALAELALPARGPAAAARAAAWRAAALADAPDWAAAAGALWAAARGPRRAAVLAALLAGAEAARRRAGDEALERGLLPALQAAAGDADVALRAAAAAAVPALARTASPDLLADLLELLERVLNRPFEIYVTDVSLDADADVSDVQAAVDALVVVLRARLLRPPGALAARALAQLVEHLERHYARPALLAARPGPRAAALAALLALRGSSRGALGWAEPPLEEPQEYSPFLLLEPAQPRSAPPAGPPPPLPQGCVVVSAARAAGVLRAVLLREQEWGVLRPVLAALPALLGSHALLLGRRAAERELLAAALCTVVAERGVRGGAGAGEWAALVLAALGALGPALRSLAPATLQRLARVLLRPAPRAAALHALALLALEAPRAMARALPELLLDLSKLSDTSQHAAPVLELLSTLARLPAVFASFVEDQYMAVFAIVLPYTNPSRYNHYVVSLAHHAIAAWFLKCRLAYRRNLVRFIIHGLHNYILVPFEQQLQPPPASNEDSSTRQRSSSLGSRGAGRGAGGAGRGAGGARAAAAEAQAAYHVELTETCVDLLARYTFTPCSVKPSRSDIAEVIFRHGQSGTWLVGHRVITITTSRCQHLALRHALCDRCMLVCRQDGEPVPASPPPAAGQPGWAAGQPAAPPPDSTLLNCERRTPFRESAFRDSLAPNERRPSRQNSGETKSDPVLEALTQRFDNIAKEMEGEAEGAAPAGGGVCACWCSAWAYVEVRAATGDVGWLQRVHNRLHAHTPSDALLDAHAALTPLQLEYEDEMRSRSDSAPQPRQPSLGGETTSAAPRVSTVVAQDNARDNARDTARDVAYDSTRDVPRDATSDATQDTVKDSSQDKSRSDAPLSRSSTAPINIPRGGGAVDDLLPLLLPAGKSRQPVKRSNSSPEMSSWKYEPLGPPLSPAPAPAPAPAPSPAPPAPAPADPPAHITLEATSALAVPQHVKKGGKKNDMRVSCEAIPEEISGTSPLAAAAPAPAAPAGPPPAPAAGAPPPSAGAPPPAAGAPPPAAGAAPPAAPAAHHLQLQKTASASAVPRPLDELPPLARAKRSNTISVCSPEHRYREGLQARAAAGGGLGGAGGGSGAGGSVGGSSSVGAGAGVGGGVTPEFVLLQLYHNMSTSPISPPLPGEAGGGAADRPLKLAGAQHERSLKNLDLLPPLDTFKVGVLYVGPGQQDDEVAILSNEFGSVRYCAFVAGLGTAVALTGAREAGGPGEPGEPREPQWLGVERGGCDGQFATVWRDDTLHVQFHVATHMPRAAADPACNEKRKYIGNDLVSIVYNDSGAPFRAATLAGQHNLCVLEVRPRRAGGVRVRLLCRDERVRRQFLPHALPAAASDEAAPLLARQWALHAALAAGLAAALALGGAPPGSPPLERLRLIKRLRRRALAERAARAAPPPYAARAARPAPPTHIDDFNDYT